MWKRVVHDSHDVLIDVFPRCLYGLISVLLCLTAKILGFVYYDFTDFMLGQVTGMFPILFSRLWLS